MQYSHWGGEKQLQYLASPLAQQHKHRGFKTTFYKDSCHHNSDLCTKPFNYDTWRVRWIQCKSCMYILLGPQKSLRFLVSARVASDPRVGIFNFPFFVCYKTMSNCSQNCWIDWNSAVLCFKRRLHIGVWTFVRPLLAVILRISIGIWSPRIQCITCFPVGKKNQKTNKWPKRRRVSAPILKPTDDQKPDTFFVWPYVGPMSMFLILDHPA